jgi:hypothetical protein
MPQLPAVVALEDIADVEGFVNATLNASGIEFQPDERDELVCEGLAILYALHQRFERRRAGYTQDGRFSGFAAMYLPRKLGDAWHRGRPEHRYVTGPDGKRSWAFFKAHVSLDGIIDGRIGTPTPATKPATPDLSSSSGSSPAGTGSPSLRPPSRHPLAQTLWRPLLEDAQAQLRLAVGVALLAEAGFNRAEIARRTGASPAALKDAWERLERVAPAIDRDSDGF